MTAKQELVNEICRSLTNDWAYWEFNKYVCRNTKSGIELWIANVPLIDLHIYQPTSVALTIIQKFKVYRAMDICRSRKLLSLL